MSQTRHIMIAVMAIGMILLAMTLFQFTSVTQSAVAATCATPTPLPSGSKVYADGYHDAGCSDGPYIYSGARSDMECADPTIRTNTGFSLMRAGVSHKAFSDPVQNGAFIEIGCAKDPSRFGDQGRYVYGSWVTTGGVYDDVIFSHLNDGDYAAHDYRVAIKNANPTVWSFIVDGVTKAKTVTTGFTRGANVTCGGEASSSQNAIGVAACWNVRYKNNDLTSWVYLSHHQKRVSAGYTVWDFSAYSWQSYGNN